MALAVMGGGGYLRWIPHISHVVNVQIGGAGFKVVIGVGRGYKWLFLDSFQTPT